MGGGKKWVGCGWGGEGGRKSLGKEMKSLVAHIIDGPDDAIRLKGHHSGCAPYSYFGRESYLLLIRVW